MRIDLKLASKMWNDGMSQAQIAEAFGVSRNVIAGQTHRNRDLFPMRNRTKVKNVSQGKSKLVRAVEQIEVEIAEVLFASIEEDKALENVVKAFPKLTAMKYDEERLKVAKTLVDNTGCKWPVSDSPYLFCGAKRLVAKSWCEHHHTRAWRAA